LIWVCVGFLVPFLCFTGHRKTLDLFFPVHFDFSFKPTLVFFPLLPAGRVSLDPIFPAFLSFVFPGYSTAHRIFFLGNLLLSYNFPFRRTFLPACPLFGKWWEGTFSFPRFLLIRPIFLLTLLELFSGFPGHLVSTLPTPPLTSPKRST